MLLHFDFHIIIKKWFHIVSYIINSQNWIQKCPFIANLPLNAKGPAVDYCRSSLIELLDS